MARRNNRFQTRTWAIRGVIAIVLGIGVGFATGASAVHLMQGPGTADADTTVADTTTRKPRRAPVAANANNENVAPRDPMPITPNGTIVPQLVGLEEGDAREAITKAGFTVGSVLFKSSHAAAGTVVSSFPVPGESVQLPATVNLILSDGRARADSLEGAPPVDLNIPASQTRR